MNDASATPPEPPVPRPSFKPLWLWTFGSAVGMGSGALAALTFFPGAAFGKYPMGPYSGILYGFSLAIGVAMALAQWLLLGAVLKDVVEGRGWVRGLWLPITGLGVAGMILPLWRFEAGILMLFPGIVAIPLLPGLIFLGLAQWLVLWSLVRAPFLWAVLTVVGGAVGASFGLFAALMLEALRIPMELTWGFVTGGGIGFLQGIVLTTKLSAAPGSA